MEKAVKFRTIMNGPYRDHPTEDALERFLLNQAEEDELDIVETHILACEVCITRLETLELNIAATKSALQSLQAEQEIKLAQPITGRAAWFSWLTLPRLSFAGTGLAACALAVTFVSVPREVTLTANRGVETTVVSEWLPLDLHLNARELPSGTVNVEVVDAQGDKEWQGEATVENDQIHVKISRLTAAGQYYVRVYSQSANDAASELLREYSLHAKPLF
jgi:hypothetical protein